MLRVMVNSFKLINIQKHVDGRHVTGRNVLRCQPLLLLLAHMGEPMYHVNVFQSLILDDLKYHSKQSLVHPYQP